MKEEITQRVTAYMKANSNKLASRMLLPFLCGIHGAMLAEESRKALSQNVSEICNALNICESDRETTAIIKNRLVRMRDKAVNLRIPNFYSVN